MTRHGVGRKFSTSQASCGPSLVEPACPAISTLPRSHHHKTLVAVHCCSDVCIPPPIEGPPRNRMPPPAAPRHHVQAGHRRADQRRPGRCVSGERQRRRAAVEHHRRRVADHQPQPVAGQQRQRAVDACELRERRVARDRRPADALAEIVQARAWRVHADFGRGTAAVLPRPAAALGDADQARCRRRCGRSFVHPRMPGRSKPCSRAQLIAVW